MIDRYAYTGICVQQGSEYLIGTPMDFPEAFDNADSGWEFYQCDIGDEIKAKALVRATVPETASIAVRIFPTYELREDWFREVRKLG